MDSAPRDGHEVRYQARSSAILVRRLGITFAMLIFIISGILYVVGNVLSHAFTLTSLLNTVQFGSIPFRVISLSIYRSPLRSNSEYKWDFIRPGEHCLRHATREYTSLLVQLSGEANTTEAMRACRDMSVEIHGRTLSTDWCLDLGLGRGIYGFWIVDFEEPDCETRWGEFNDLGCSSESVDSEASNQNEKKRFDGSSERKSVRHIESRLENLQPGSNWKIMCVTTPADINGRHFGSPADCLNDVQEGVIYGEWDIDDRQCT